MARWLRSLWTATVRSGDIPTDAELLDRFRTGGDHAAFELIVRRHSAAVWAACRGILRNDTDADDAAQVTFFTLTRNARSVKAGATLGGWLHRVAVHAALKLRAKRRPTTALPDVPFTHAEANDSAAVLHEELAQLPAAYREVIVAVDLEGYGHADAAKVLGWPVGTVSGRVVRARDELRRRLERRGVTAAVVTASVTGSSIRAAVDMAVGAVVAPPEVVSLSTEVWAMIATGPRKLVAAVCVLVMLALGGAGVVAVAQSPKPADPPKATPAKADPPAKTAEAERKPVEKMEDLPEIELLDTDSPEVTLAKKMILLQLKRHSLIEQKIAAGQFSGAASYIQLSDTLAELTAAAEEAFPAAKDQLSWFEYRFAELTRWERYIATRVKEGIEDPPVGPQVRAAMFKSELALLKVQKKLKK